MTSIDFYFNAQDKLTVACRLAGKALAQKKRLLIYAPQAETDGRTPAEAWAGVNPHVTRFKQEYWFEAWDGLLQGYYLRR